eukprot:CAMPEP_0179346916 /NCGR_PEP_ID=MMETSP0797-20121207/72828_1 /TAXON_ID=47934 /ORGANISM="Dinophysis acuminata, Strain DAEP01" /LENGTH=48 /DNA_ID= /DNA_START= /DNA_END= /DNA_ORIENTATION=
MAAHLNGLSSHCDLWHSSDAQVWHELISSPADADYRSGGWSAGPGALT